MRPATITLVRHGESRGNVDRTTFNAITDDLFDLTPEGEKQAEAAIPIIRCVIGRDRALFYTSPYRRCKRTTEIIRAGLDPGAISVIEDNNLRERKIGNLINVEELHAVYEQVSAQGFFFRPPNGESFSEVMTRTEIFRTAMQKRWESPHHPPHVVIIGHNTALKTFLMSELLISSDNFRELNAIGNAQVITLRPKDTLYGVQYFPDALPIGITEKQINSAIS